MWNKTLLSLALCLLGCSIQVIDISNRYFRYATKTKVAIKIIPSLKSPKISICWLITESLRYDMMDARNDMVNEKYRSYLWDWNQEDSLNGRNLIKLIDDLTVADILDITFSNYSILREDKACARKNSTDLVWRKWNSRTECLKILKIQKYLNRCLICYKIEYVESEKDLFYIDVSFSPSHPGLMQKYYLNEEIFKRFTMYSIYIHSKESSDLYDSVFSIVNAINFNDTPLINSVFSPAAAYRLQAPYDTNCRSFPGYGSVGEYQIEQLTNLTIERLQHVPTLGHVYQKHQYPMITDRKLMNETFHDEFIRLKTSIFTRRWPNCALIYNVPHTITEEGDAISISINWPQQSATKVQFVPDQESIDFIVYVLSSVGIWFGLSMFSILSSGERIFIKHMKPETSKNGPEFRRKELIQEEKRTFFIIKDRDLVLRSRIHNMNRRIDIIQRSLIRLQSTTNSN